MLLLVSVSCPSYKTKMHYCACKSHSHVDGATVGDSQNSYREAPLKLGTGNFRLLQVALSHSQYAKRKGENAMNGKVFQSSAYVPAVDKNAVK